MCLSKSEGVTCAHVASQSAPSYRHSGRYPATTNAPRSGFAPPSSPEPDAVTVAAAMSARATILHARGCGRRYRVIHISGLHPAPRAVSSGSRADGKGLLTNVEHFGSVFAAPVDFFSAPL